VTGELIRGYAWFAVGYFTVLNTAYLGLIMLAARDAVTASRWRQFTARADILASPLATPISIVVPAHDEEAAVVECTRGLLNLRYPQFEVIVVDDGSTDATFERLRAAFDLAEIPKVIRTEIPALGKVLSVHAPRNREPLLVVRKQSIGRPADAVNTGVNAARYPLVCRVDADSYLDADALLAVVQPFIEDPRQVVAAGATIRVANACVIRSGRVVESHMPAGWLPPIQAVEYLRSFLLGRAGWSQVRGMLFISGAFGLFRRDVFELAGGLDLESEGDDVELVTDIHHRLLSQHRRYRVDFVPDPCCWTVVPTRYAALAHQRSRWAQILTEALWAHRAMMFNPRYGLVGMVILPYYAIFELGSAAVELAGIAALAAGLALHIVSPALALLFILMGIGYATALSVAGVIIEELTYNRYRAWRDFALLLFAAIAENLGFRQAHAWWRLRGIGNAMLRRRAKWLHTKAPQVAE
jgi:cellulose synthase/poly-beta-1,6-N-acetylglucosamine synthase-like glycosyltransferase